MRDSQLGFSYNWKDLRPIHSTMLFVLLAQAVGALLGIAFKLTESNFVSAWVGSAIFTTPAYFTGIAWQAAKNGAALRPYRKMVLRGAGICLVLSLVATYLLLNEPESRFYRGGDAALQALIESSQQLQSEAALGKATDCRFSRTHPKAHSAYRCQVPESSRDSIRSALVSGGWETIPLPPNTLFAYRRQEQIASFACPWKAGHCELWLSHQQ